MGEVEKIKEHISQGGGLSLKINTEVVKIDMISEKRNAQNQVSKFCFVFYRSRK